MSEAVDLSAASIEALASRLAELLGEATGSRPADGEMITAAEVSRRWGLSRRWVYENARALGVHHVGGGTRPRLRFDPAEIADRLGAAALPARPSGADPGAAGKGPEEPGSDSLRPPTGAIVLESQIAAGGRRKPPGPAPEKMPRRGPRPGRRTPRRRPGRGGGAR